MQYACSHLIPNHKLAELSTVSESSPTDPNVLNQAQVLDLMLHLVVNPVPWLFGFVGFDTSDIGGGALH